MELNILLTRLGAGNSFLGGLAAGIELKGDIYEGL